MSAFILIDVHDVTDEEKMNEYRSKVFANVAEFEGTYRVVGGEQTELEGEAAFKFPVLIEFASKEKALRWYESPEYRPLRELRLASTHGTGILIDGDVNSLAN